MSHRIARLVEPLLRLLLPGLGRHRLAVGNRPPTEARRVIRSVGMTA